MADDLTVSTSAGGPTSSIPNATRFSLEEITSLNGAVVAAALAQRIILALRTADATAVDVSAAAPLPVTMATGPLPAGAATEATLAGVLAAVDAVFGAVDGLEGKDFATQTTLAAVLAKLSADPATQTTLAAILAKIHATPATEAKQDTGNTSLATIAGKDFATQTTLAAILAKIIASPATEATLAAILAAVDGLELGIAGLTTPLDTQPVSIASPIPVTDNGGSLTVDGTVAVSGSVAVTGPLTDAQLRASAVPVSMAAAPTGAATAAKQDDEIALLTAQALFLDGLESALASILAKIIAAPSTEAKQDTEITHLAIIAGAIAAAIVQANVAKINGVTPLMGNGVTGTGSQRVTIASDNSPVPISASHTQKYGASAAFTITLASLATSSTRLAGRQSTVVVTTAPVIDYLVGGKITVGTTPTANKQIDIWVYAAVNDTPTYPDALGTADAAFTSTNAEVRNMSMRLLATILVVATTSDVAYWIAPTSIAALFGGVLPARWGLFVTHDTVAALHATGGNHALSYTPVYSGPA